jgi:outer membrane protein
MRQFAVTVLGAALLSVVSVSAQADTLLGIYGGVDGIFHNSDAENSADNDVVASYYLAFEHPIPFLPNAKVRYIDFDQTDETPLTGININSKSKVELLDVIGYYEVLDNVVSVDVGAGAKRVNTNYDAVVSNGNAFSKVTNDYEETIPALYASVGGKLPFTGFSAKAEAFVGKGSDASFNDYNAEIKYNFIENFAIDLGAKVGLRAMKVSIDDDTGSENEIKVIGPYLGLEAHF